MHATTVLGYTYDADYHCLACTYKRFARNIAAGEPGVDSEGNEIHPIFASDEWYDSNEKQTLHCGDCHDVIDEYDPT